MPKVSTTGILLAAGRSSRMGRPKLLLPWGPGTVIGSLVRAFKNGGIDDLRLVVAPNDPDLLKWARQRDLKVVVNPEPQRGMLSSLWEALDDLVKIQPEEVANSALLISPADYPLVSASTIAKLSSGKQGFSMVVPTYRGKRGHPVWVGPKAIPHLKDLSLSQGLRSLRERILWSELPVEDPGILLDIDTPEDYEKYSERSEFG